MWDAFSHRLGIWLKINASQNDSIVIRKTFGTLLHRILPLIIGGWELVRFVENGEVAIDGRRKAWGCTVGDENSIAIFIVSGDDTAGIRIE